MRGPGGGGGMTMTLKAEAMRADLHIERNHPITTWFKIGGGADLFCRPRDAAHLAAVLRAHRLPEGADLRRLRTKILGDASGDFLCGGTRRVPRAPLPALNPLEGWRKPVDTGLRATWLGHSTVLVEIGGARLLTDPVWGRRASPSQLAGPKRFQPVPVPLKALPPIDAVLLSHDHYDHLCLPTVRALAKNQCSTCGSKLLEKVSAKMTAYEQLNMPLDARSELQEYGYILPPDSVMWIILEIPGTQPVDEISLVYNMPRKSFEDRLKFAPAQAASTQHADERSHQGTN